MLSRPTYRGLRRKLVLAFDLGTTYSGISYRYALTTVSMFKLFNRRTPVFLIPAKYQR
jgi:hypothetical protein